MKHVLLLVFLIAGSRVAPAQLLQDFPLRRDDQAVVVELYRGIVEVLPSNNGRISYSARLLDADRYMDDPAPPNLDALLLRERAEVTVTRREGALLFKTQATREVVHLRLWIPAAMDIEVQIAHAGSISVRGRRGNVSGSIFNGDIEVREATGALSLETVRSGSIHVHYSDSPTQPLIATSFTGVISVEYPGPVSLDADVRSDMGQLLIQVSGAEHAARPAGSFEVVENGRRVQHEASWKRIRSGAGSVHMLLYSVQSDVHLIEK